ncbi:MAG: DOMON-like domain-containing protein [Rhodocyclaceae bacterium]|nr:DOMON-like domain-containing protein [Rhodocyclaceae bacterium]
MHSRYVLQPHAANPPTEGIQIDAAAAALPGGDLRLEYRLRGPLERLRLPPPAPPRATDGLWRHTCFEAFVGTADGAAYREFNFSPSGCWAAYGFSDARRRDAFAASGDCPVAARTGADTLLVTATIPAAWLPAWGEWQVGLSAVVEMTDGRLGYWALHHPPGAPDLHAADGRRLIVARASDPEVRQ